MVPATETLKRPIFLAIWLMVAAVVGWIAAFALTMEKFNAYVNPGEGAGCDFSVVVQCTANLNSAQGSLLGFPNPLIGLTAWMAPLVVGAAILAGAQFHRWFWITFAAGITAAMSFVVFLIITSIYFLGTLCPWCMVTWTVTIPTFLAVWLYILKTGIIPVGDRGRRAAEAAFSWVPVISILVYLTVAVLAQLRLDWMQYL